MAAPAARVTSIAARLLAVIWPFVGIVVLLVALGARTEHALAGVRAYSTGNAIWAAAQKQAVIQLHRYAETGEPRHYAAYLAEMAIPRADRRAREAILATPLRPLAVRKALIAGRNAPEDVDLLLRFLREFQDYPPVHAAVAEWLRADALVGKLEIAATTLHDEVAAGRRGSDRAVAALAQIDRLDVELTSHEHRFGQHMVTAARQLRARLRLVRLGSALVLGLLGLLLSLRAVARQLAAERALRASEQRHELIAEGANDGIWEWDVGSGALYCSPRVREMLGYDESALNKARDLARFMTPEDFAVARKQIYDHLERGDRGALSRTLRMRAADGRELWILARSITRYGDDGKPWKVAGSYTDITARVENERQLRLAANVFDAAYGGIVITDAADRIVSANRAFQTMAGRPGESLTGRRVQTLLAPEVDRERRRGIAHRLRAHGTWNGEIAARSLTGEIHPIALSIVNVADAGGATVNRIYVCEDITARKYAQARIHHLAYFDSLTGLPNRDYLRANFERYIDAARVSGKPLAVVFFDLDGFKGVNDTLGHDAGDQLVRQVALRLAGGAGDDCLLCRFGGDEFLLLVPDCAAATVEPRVAELLRRIGEPVALEGQTLAITASAGYAMYPHDARDAESLVRYADMALYRAKEHGKNIVEHYQSWMSTAVTSRHDLLADIRAALAKDQFRLRFQPVINVASGRVSGVESLLYWEHPERGTIGPASFIPLAEESGLIEPIGVWLFDAALGQYARWRAAGLPAFYIAINLSGYQLRNATNLEQQFFDAVARHGVDCSKVVLEITERQIVSDAHATLPVLNHLSARGVGLSIDDFGTGYSSLEYLKDMPVTQIKIDKAFVHNLVTEVGDRAIVSAIAGLGHSLGVDVVAEGVENEGQLKVLHGYGCNLVQGYLFAPPLVADEVDGFVRARAASVA